MVRTGVGGGVGRTSDPTLPPRTPASRAVSTSQQTRGPGEVPGTHRPCWKCHRETTVSDWLCDWYPCLESVCRICHPLRRVTAWCPAHRPVSVIPFLRWRVTPYLLHPGRSDKPGVHETVSRLSSVVLAELSIDQIAARSCLETSRRKVVSLVDKMRKWILLHPAGARRAKGNIQKERRLVMRFLLDHGRETAKGLRTKRNMLQNMNKRNILSTKGVKGKSQAKKNVSVKQAGMKAEEPGVRPTTMTSWARLLSAAFPEKLGRGLEGFMKGLCALAPNAPEVERGNSASWDRVQEAARIEFLKDPNPIDAAVWLAIYLQRSGLRPKAAIRAAMLSGTRVMTHLKGVPGLRVSVLIDKDNPVGRSPAPRVRFIRLKENPHLPRLLEQLPLPDEDYGSTFTKRKELLAAQGVSHVISARRNAAEKADDCDLSPNPILNHVPGSASTVRYVGSATPAAVVRALAQW